MDRPPTNLRIQWLDGLRGVLAVCVLADHLALQFNIRALMPVGLVAVAGFFAMSGFVLARSYDRRPIAFMTRRFIRLWPLYAVCIVIGYARFAELPPALELFWWPIPVWGAIPRVDHPAWSLYYEAWVTPLFPVMFLIGRKSTAVAAAISCGVFVLGLIDVRLSMAAFFMIGVTTAQFDIRFPAKVDRVTAWLGKVSFSLYLTHEIVLEEATSFFGPWGAVAALPIIFSLAWLTWRWIELPSIAWSRRIGGSSRLGPSDSETAKAPLRVTA